MLPFHPISPTFHVAPGRVVTTSSVSKLDPAIFTAWLARHFAGDYGEVKQYEEEVAENDRVMGIASPAFQTGKLDGEIDGRILSRYTHDGESYYVITEWHDPGDYLSSVTTILNVWEY